MLIKVIQTEDGYNNAMQRVDELMDKNPEVGSLEFYELDALAAVIESYERLQGYMQAQEAITPLDIIKFRMEQNNLSAQDMVGYFGSRSKVSEVLNGKRPLSLNMIRKLNKGLHIPAELLL